VPAENPLKVVTWQSENCLACKWFRPSDPINADILTTGKCVQPDLRKYELVISGRDWCNLFEEVSQKQIDAMQEHAMKAEKKAS
jgi:hypothetical protein